MSVQELIPPAEKNFVGDGDFIKIGETFLGYFKDLCGLQPTARVLDVGCGIGRMAIPLTQYLNDEGGYEGFDIVPDGIRWCESKITPAYPHFRFTHANIYNKQYNPGGVVKAADYDFPYASRTFDFVFLTSVFTHMLPADMENYLAEISRVLKPGGRCLITYFVLNAEAESYIKAGRGVFQFPHRYGCYGVQDQSMPEGVVGYDEVFVRDLFEKYGLRIDSPIHYGNWCGRPDHVSGQDMVVATKVRNVPNPRKSATPTIMQRFYAWLYGSPTR
jgi:SAM-dependent methyltransferase